MGTKFEIHGWRYRDQPDEKSGYDLLWSGDSFCHVVYRLFRLKQTWMKGELLDCRRILA